MNEVKITPLGGLGEIGLNCQLWEADGRAVMIDCGLMFPDDSQLGVDMLVPNVEAIKMARDKLLAIILTHGHEDHIGALPWIIPFLKKGVKIYSSRFTLALLSRKLEEYKLNQHVELHAVDEQSVLRLGKFVFHFLPVCHSIPHGFALGVDTPAGKFIHSGDFRLDPQAPDGKGANLQLFADYAGADGVRLLLSDSTNVLRHGHAITEGEVKKALGQIFSTARGRIVITLFSSHIQRIQEVFDLAAGYGKSVIVSGKSIAGNIAIASSLGDLSLPPKFYNAYNGVPDVPLEDTVLIVTGAQGEPLSALHRMVMGGHRQLDILPGDTVVMSSRVIPGHAKAVSRLIDEMYRLGAEVYYEGSHPVHASGHAHAEELGRMIRTARPQMFMPIHGEYRHLFKHARLAEENGVDPDNVLCVENGRPVLIGPDYFELQKPLPMAATFVDGKGVGDVDGEILQERRILADEGLFSVSLALGQTSGKLLSGPDIVSLGFMSGEFRGDLLDEARSLVLAECDMEKDADKLRENIKSALRRHFRKLLDRDPMTLVLISLIPEDASLPPDEPGPSAREA